MAVEDQTEDGDEEQEFDGQDGLDHGQIAETQGRGLQDELHQQEGEAQEPDPPLEGIGEQAQVHGVGRRGMLDPDALQYAGHGTAEGGGGRQDINHATFYNTGRTSARNVAGPSQFSRCSHDLT